MLKFFYPPGLLHSYIAVEFFQSVLSSVMVHNQDALLHVRPLGSLENSYWSTRTLKIITSLLQGCLDTDISCMLYFERLFLKQK